MFTQIHLARSFGAHDWHIKRRWPIRGRLFLLLEGRLRRGITARPVGL